MYSLFVSALLLAAADASRLSAQTDTVAGNSLSAGESQDLDALRKAGFAHLKLADWKSANETFEKILAIEVNDYLSLYGNAVALFNIKRPVEAEANIVRAIDILSKTKANDRLLADSFVLKAVMYATRGDSETAIEILLKATRLVPAHFDAHFTLGRAYFGNGDVDRAVRSFQKAVEIMPRNIDARFFLATTLERRGDYEPALAAYRAMLSLNGQSARANLGLGVLLIKLEGDKSAEGVAALRKAIAINGELYEARITLGKSLLRTDQAEEAVEHLKKAADLAPNNPEPHYQLAMAYRQLGRKEDAAEQFRIVRRIHEERRKALQN
ncbi:MAG: tetratricopeptide repeat protein [Acidobacteriota bacterium]|nr:tetratricopeptide repeat protein [Acidobacteriota bacterium]